MRKKIAAFMTVAMVCCLVAIPTAAATGIMPFWANTASIALSLTFAGGQASVGGIIDGNSNTTGITATYYLQEKTSGGGWTTITTWPQASTTSRTLTFTGTTSATSGKTYRLYVNSVVTNSAGTPETVTSTHEKTY